MVRNIQVGNEKNLGFTYLGLLFILAMLSLSLAMAGTLWSFAQKREKERELLFVGNQFRQAIKMYYEKTPGVIKRYPQNLDQLLEDDRYVSVQRYLRKIYPDPITGFPEWGVIIAPEGGVMGVYSKSNQQTLKISNLLPDGFYSNSLNYSDWKFFYAPIIAISPR